MSDFFGLEGALLLPALYQAMQWRLAELESPHGVREIAISLGIEQAQVDATVTVLIHHGFFRLNGQQVERTIRSSQLLPSHPFSSFVRAYGNPANVQLWARLGNALAQEKPPHDNPFIVDLLWRAGDENAAFLDLQYLLEGKQGRLRTEEEINALLTASGFERIRSVAFSNSSVTLVEGVAA
jgi:hypothetical protein